MKLLLAEDEKNLSKVLVKILKKSGFEVEPVFNGQDALDYIEDGEYDGLILDIMMPVLDGLEVLESLRRSGNEIPVLMLTAKSEVPDKVKGLDMGADDYLTKPFATEELVSRVKAMTRRRNKTISDSILVFEDLSLDTSCFTMTTSSSTVSLNHKEYQIMELFFNNKGQYISVDRLFERVWGYDSDSEIAVVWANISNLRSKLRILQTKVEIVAKRKVGYRLESVNDE